MGIIILTDEYKFPKTNFRPTDWRVICSSKIEKNPRVIALVNNALVTTCKNEKCMFKIGTELLIKIDSTNVEHIFSYAEFDDEYLISI